MPGQEWAAAPSAAADAARLAAGTDDDRVSLSARLHKMRTSGVPTHEEVAAAKRKLLSASSPIA
jgi:hypothetical protein